MIDGAMRGAWRDLEGKLRPFVARRVSSPVDTDDVLQDIYLKMLKGLGGLRDDERFGPWVYQVARSAIADHGRVARRHRVVDGVDVDEDMAEVCAGQADVHNDDDDRILEQQLANAIAPFVATLGGAYQEALTLVELEGRTHREAADLIGISLSGMKSRVQRGRVKLREVLEDCCHIALDVRGRVVGCERRVEGTAPDGCCHKPNAETR